MKNKEILLLAILIFLLASIIFVVADSQLFIPAGGDNQLNIIGSGGTDSQFSLGPTITFTSPPTSHSSSNQGTGTNSGIGGGLPSLPIVISPSSLNINLALGEKIEKTISVTNIGANSLNLSISQENLTQLVVLRNTSIYLNPNETKNLDIAFIDNNKTGVFTGKILVGTTEIPVSLNIMTEKLLFDVGVSILNFDSKVTQFGKLRTEMTILPKGDQARIDVQVNYLIKDYNDNVYMNKTEAILIDSNTTIERDFNIGSLKLGNYSLGVQVTYPGGVASASSNFKVTEGVIIGEALYNSFLIILFSSIIVLVLLIIQSARREQDYNS